LRIPNAAIRNRESAIVNNYLFRGATLVTLDPPAVEQSDLRIEDGRVADRGQSLGPSAQDEIVDVHGKVVMPGMVCGHTHLYSTLARGMPPPERVPVNFREILELIWWRLDRALDEETIYWSALAGALDAARAGTTCLFDHHASPTHIKGSLKLVSDAIEKAGLRGVLCYEVTDRGDRRQRAQGIEENRDFLEQTKRTPRLFRGMVGAHASFTLSDESIRACAGLMRHYDAGLHIHAAEDACDVEDARAQHGMGVVERLARHDALNWRTILAHGIHLDANEIGIARGAGVWFAHNPRSNMNNRVGHAPVDRFGERVVIGTDGIGADMLEEARFGFFKGRDGGLEVGAGDWIRMLANGQRMASEAFGMRFDTLRPGSAADLIVIDYQSPTPLSSENLAGHFLFGLHSAAVESVMVGGRFIMKDRRFPLDERGIYAEARKASRTLWARLQAM
jgi:putative selenium metabolism protein SsnA